MMYPPHCILNEEICSHVQSIWNDDVHIPNENVICQNAVTIKRDIFFVCVRVHLYTQYCGCDWVVIWKEF